jgi:hypothetical protein
VAYTRKFSFGQRFVLQDDEISIVTVSVRLHMRASVSVCEQNVVSIVSGVLGTQAALWKPWCRLGMKLSPARLKTRTGSEYDCNPSAHRVVTTETLNHDCGGRRVRESHIVNQLLNDGVSKLQPRLSGMRIWIAGALIGCCSLAPHTSVIRSAIRVLSPNLTTSTTKGRIRTPCVHHHSSHRRVCI